MKLYSKLFSVLVLVMSVSACESKNDVDNENSDQQSNPAAKPKQSAAYQNNDSNLCSSTFVFDYNDVARGFQSIMSQSEYLKTLTSGSYISESLVKDGVADLKETVENTESKVTQFENAYKGVVCKANGLSEGNLSSTQNTKSIDADYQVGLWKANLNKMNELLDAI